MENEGRDCKYNSTGYINLPHLIDYMQKLMFYVQGKGKFHFFAPTQ
jgi:hypothetical protein